MAKYRCQIALSFCSRPDIGITRAFEVGDEIVSDHPLDELFVSKRAGAPFFLKVSDDAVVEPEPVALEDMTVDALREVAAQMGYNDLPKSMKKTDLVAFLKSEDGAQ